MPTLDLDYVRAQFPAFLEPSLQGQAFFENAGGSYACAPVIARLAEYYRRMKLQPYYPYPASTEAGDWMDASHRRLAAYLGVGADWLHFGPSTSQNSYVLANALRKRLKPGDEVIVTNQDHEANSGAWRRATAEAGATLREWTVDPVSGRLDPAALDGLLGERTRLIAFTHCSNLVAELNPVAAICQKARAVGAVTVVDGVAAAPHGLPDVAALGCDVYLFSLYKTFGPHLGLMALRPALRDWFGNEGHFFNAGLPRKRLLPAGPDHAQVAAAQGVADYFDGLDVHHGGRADDGRPQRVRELLRAAEQPGLSRLLEWLAARDDLRLIGPADARQRAATVSFRPSRRRPVEVTAALAQQRILAAAGHFYALRLLQGVGLDPAEGVVRLSFVHYTAPEEIERLLDALQIALD